MRKKIDCGKQPRIGNSETINLTKEISKGLKEATYIFSQTIWSYQRSELMGNDSPIWFKNIRWSVR